MAIPLGLLSYTARQNRQLGPFKPNEGYWIGDRFVFEPAIYTPPPPPISPMAPATPGITDEQKKATTGILGSLPFEGDSGGRAGDPSFGTAAPGGTGRPGQDLIGGLRGFFGGAKEQPFNESYFDFREQPQAPQQQPQGLPGLPTNPAWSAPQVPNIGQLPSPVTDLATPTPQQNSAIPSRSFASPPEMSPNAVGGLLGQAVEKDIDTGSYGGIPAVKGIPGVSPGTQINTPEEEVKAAAEDAAQIANARSLQERLDDQRRNFQAFMGLLGVGVPASIASLPDIAPTASAPELGGPDFGGGGSGVGGDVSGQGPGGTGQLGFSAGPDQPGTTPDTPGGVPGNDFGFGTGPDFGNQDFGDFFRTGGRVPKDADKKLEPVPAVLHEGEYVIRPEAVTHYGVGILSAINKKKLDRKKVRGLLAR